jgi:hypothetical protein
VIEVGLNTTNPAAPPLEKVGEVDMRVCPPEKESPAEV